MVIRECQCERGKTNFILISHIRFLEIKYGQYQNEIMNETGRWLQTKTSKLTNIGKLQKEQSK